MKAKPSVEAIAFSLSTDGYRLIAASQTTDNPQPHHPCSRTHAKRPPTTLLQSGNALVAQAQAVATQDFSAARALWRQAGVLFQRAHEADPALHAAAFRLGQAWVAEAHALQKEGSEDATAMWRQAALQCEVAFALDPHHAVTAMHIASCYAWAQDADAKLAWAQIAQHLQEEHAANMAADEAAR